MSEATQPATDERLEDFYYPSLRKNAVALCTEVSEKIHAATRKQIKNLYTAGRCAAKAYRVATPPLSGYQNTCGFIACAGYGMLLGAIKPAHGTKLLYAAQVALTAIPKEAKTQTRN